MNENRANAEKLISDVDAILDDHRDTDYSDEAAYAYALATATQAVACATLYLAEQQRAHTMALLGMAQYFVKDEATFEAMTSDELVVEAYEIATGRKAES